jgi:hypothetical protein
LNFVEVMQAIYSESNLLSRKQSREDILSYYSQVLPSYSFNYVISFQDIWSIMLGSSIAARHQVLSLSMSRKNDPNSADPIHLVQLLPSIPLPDDFKVIIVSSGVNNESCDDILDMLEIFQWQFPDSLQSFICLSVAQLSSQQEQRLLQIKQLLLYPSELLSDKSAALNQEPSYHSMKRKLISSSSIHQLESNVPGEDRYSIRILADDIKLFAVIDGHGGYLAADMACALLLDMILSKLLENGFLACDSMTIYEIIRAAFRDLDELILNQTSLLISHPPAPTSSSSSPTASKRPIFQLAGCCVVLALVLGSDLYVAHVG